ncbi:DUF1129 domain-containing protein [Streptococcus zalophi]|uniref:DUF1129 family protein n=1 Tax=Streptococcus zalophi TaxID=640031 RepID=A0A934UDV8_9STRE|nr:DUF1129 family protein [Streptococcus zalophi]MBJ8350174.1 DUF1129 family protein [Streptococcus zalophi]MCR8968214.1 DUF1129 family protein [Streptococcus zalophi]
MQMLNNLTKKNQEFIHIATNQLIKDGKNDEEIKTILEDIIPQILEQQKKGIPARTFLGAPTVWASQFSNQALQKQKELAEKNTNPWLMWLDTSLLFIAIVAFVNAVMNLVNPTAATTGIVSLILIGFGGGGAMYAVYHSIYRHVGKPKSTRPSFLKTIGILSLAMALWLVVSASSSFLPASINIPLSFAGLLIIAAISFGIRYYLQKKYNVLNAMAPQRQ